MSKKIIRAAAVLCLLIFTAEGAGQDLKHRSAVEYGQIYSTDDIVGLEENGRENQSAAKNQTCQMHDTKFTYYDGSYYYQSSADYFYLYKSDADGENKECLAQQVPEEIYVMGEWVYFTNVSAGGSVYRIQQDGSGMEEVFDKQVSRFVLMGDTFYCLSGGNVYSWSEERGAELFYEGNCEWIFTKGRIIYLDITETEGEEKNHYTAALDAQGTILATYSGGHRYKIPAGGFFII